MAKPTAHRSGTGDRLVVAFGRWLRGLIFFFFVPLILIVVIAWYVAVPWLTADAATAWLAARGLGPASLQVRALTLRQADLVDLSIGNGTATMSHVSVTYTIDGLRAERVKTVTVTGLHVYSRITDNRLDLGPLGQLFAGDATAASETPPVDTVVINDSAWHIETNEGALTVGFDGAVRLDGGRLIGEMTLRPESPLGGATVGLELDLDPAARAGDIYATLTNIWAQWPGGGVRGAAGEVAITVADGGLADVYGFVDDAAAQYDLVAGDGSVSFHYDGRNAAVVADIEALNGAVAGHGEFSIESLGAAGSRLAANGRLTIDAPALGPWLGARIGVRADRSTPARIAWHATGAAPTLLDVVDGAAIERWLGSAQLTGDLAFDVPPVAVPGFVAAIRATGNLALGWTGAGLAVTGRGASLDLVQPDLDQVGLDPRNGLISPFVRRLSITMPAEPPAELLIRPRTGGGLAADLADLDVRLAGDGAAVRFGLDTAELALTPGGGVRLGRYDGVRLTVGRWEPAIFGLALKTFSLGLSGTAARARGRLALQAAGTPALAIGDRTGLPPVALDLDLGIDYAGRRLRLNQTSAAPLRFGAVPVGDDGASLAPIALTLAGDVPAVIDVDLSQAGRLTWRGAAGLAPIDLELRGLAAGGVAPSVIGTTPRLDISGAGEFTDRGTVTWTARAKGAGGSAEISVPQAAGPLRISATGIDIDWQADQSGAGAGRLRVKDLVQQGPPRYVAPLSLAAEGAMTAGSDAIDFQVQLGDRSGMLVIALDGVHQPARARGSGRLTLYPIHFFEGGFQPTQLLPFLKRRLGLTTGRIEMAGDLFWSNRGLVSALDLVLDNVSTRVDDIEVLGVNGAVRIDRPWPPSTPPGQLIAVEGIDLGLPLSAGLVTARLDKFGLPFVERSEWRWAGGRVTTAGSRPSGDEGPDIVTLDIEGIELDQLLELTPEATNITATGRLNGRIPVVYRDGSFSIVEGWLESDFDGGTIKYTPEELSPGLLAGGAGVKLLLDALDDFHYSRLRIEISGRGENQVEMRFRIRGANPALYGGAEFELNLNIDGALEQILRDSYRTYYELPDAVAERLSRARRGP